MQVHLVNPSHVSFGVGVITPRWLFVLAAATPQEFGDPLITDETLEHARRLDASSRATSSASASTPATRCAATRSAAPARAARRLGRLRRHPRHALSRGSARARRRARRRQGRRRRRLGPGDRRLRRAARRSGSTKAAGSRPSDVHAGALGPAARRALHVGVGADGARLPEALLVLLGVADRRPAAAPARRSTPSSRRSSSCGAAGSGSSRSPTTTSIPSRSRTCAMAARRAGSGAPRAAQGACARSASS